MKVVGCPIQCKELLFLGTSGGDSHFVATIDVRHPELLPGFADFLVADGDGVWTTNQGRVEKLQRNHPGPVATVPVPDPCGAMEIGFGALWVANCQDASLYRIDLKATRVTERIPTGLADPKGELSLAVGAGSVWLLTDESGVLSRVDPQTNRVSARIKVAPGSYAACLGLTAFGLQIRARTAVAMDSSNALIPVRIVW
jgi:virginiamycin B lyase